MPNKPTKILMPPEWSEHRATWIAWPHLESDFPGKIEPVRWAFCELIRHLSKHECVEILCATPELQADLHQKLKRSNIAGDIRSHVVPYERTWLRDSAPTFVHQDKKPHWVNWRFNAWAKYDNFGPDQKIAGAISEISKIGLIPAERFDKKEPLVMEGGAFDVDGEGTVLVTEQCLLSDTQERNPGLSKQGYEQAFAEYLGATKTIWLGDGPEGDDTNGHIDDVARFVAPGKVVISVADASDATYYKSSKENLVRLKAATDAKGRALEVIAMPVSQPIFCDGERLPASYMNFYIGNGSVLMPTFNDPKDRIALGILSELFPSRQVIGIHCVDWILGLGSLHCSTQQEPA